VDEVEETVRLLVMEHGQAADWNVVRYVRLLDAEGVQVPLPERLRLWGMYGTRDCTHDAATGRAWTPQQRMARAFRAG
jgi:hypothetical protein